MSAYRCNLLVPGAAKSGTTTLNALLESHPDICMCTPKEPQFFALDDLYAQGATLHNSYFKHDTARYWGDASQFYFVSDEAIKRLAEDLDAPKIILTLRHPVKRIWSHYRFHTRKGMVKQPLIETLESQLDHVDFAQHNTPPYLLISKYHHYVPLWQRTFGEENVLILSFDEIQYDQESIKTKVCDFLGIAPFGDAQTHHEYATADIITQGDRPAWMQQLAKRLPSTWKDQAWYQQLRASALKPFARTPPSAMTDAERTYLESRLAEDIAYYDALFGTC